MKNLLALNLNYSPAKNTFGAKLSNVIATYEAFSTVQKAYKYIDAWKLSLHFFPNNIFCISLS